MSLDALISQGGFAVLAAFAIGTIFQLARMWVADIKASAERERTLTNRALDVITNVTTAVTAQNEKILGLDGQIAGLRSICHTIGNAVADFPAVDHRLSRLEKLEEALRAEKTKAATGSVAGGAGGS